MIKVAIYVYVTDEVDISNQLVNAFQIRVGAAGGVVEASECLLTELESYWLFWNDTRSKKT
jgi:hypothetical protein